MLTADIDWTGVRSTSTSSPSPSLSSSSSIVGRRSSIVGRRSERSVLSAVIGLDWSWSVGTRGTYSALNINNIFNNIHHRVTGKYRGYCKYIHRVKSVNGWAHSRAQGRLFRACSERVRSRSRTVEPDETSVPRPQRLSVPAASWSRESDWNWQSRLSLAYLSPVMSSVKGCESATGARRWKTQLVRQLSRRR